MMINILLLGSGGRENAFAWKMAQSPQLGQLYIAPGNAGTALYGENLSIGVADFTAIKKVVLEKQIDMVVVGPEEPLVKGIYDFFIADKAISHIPVIGPSAQGAMLEGSKDFSKAFMARHGIPTAAYHSFTADTLLEGYAFLDTLAAPYVLKADGLAAGKGVLICTSLEEAKKELELMLIGEKFGKASEKVVIEQFLKGIELSVFVLTDGKSYLILPEAKDYKRIGDNDTGLNTGGMGAVSPVPFANKAFIDKVEQQVVIPTIEGLKKEGIAYKGFIFIGLMNDGGNPFVIEYNVRMGDPETEVVIPRISSDLVDLFQGVASQQLSEKKMEVNPATAVTLMLVSGGYPGDYEKGKVITGIDQVKDSLVFQAGTKIQEKQIVTDGGRVIAVTSMADDMLSAVNKSYASASLIQYEGKYHRSDIGQDLLPYITK